MKAWLFELLKKWFVKESSVPKASPPLVNNSKPFRSKTLHDYLVSKEINLKDPIAANVAIRKFFKSTPDTAILEGNVNSKQTIVVKATSNVVVANIKDLKLKECSLIFRSDFENTIVIINVSGNLSFIREGRLEVRGTITPNDVLINYTGPFNPTLMTNSSLIGTVVTLNKLTVLRGCRFQGETIGSDPIVSNGVITTNS